MDDVGIGFEAATCRFANSIREVSLKNGWIFGIVSGIKCQNIVYTRVSTRDTYVASGTPTTRP